MVNCYVLHMQSGIEAVLKFGAKLIGAYFPVCSSSMTFIERNFSIAAIS